MEFKGITWAGNIYQKFETMCLEVEEAMYEDTVKYVENQVQKVGFSVKKFCSAVTEDFLPPSGVYPVNLASGDLSLNSYGDIDVIKKPVPSVFDCHHDHKKKEIEDEVIPNPTAEKKPPLNSCYDINSLFVHSKPRAIIRKKPGLPKNPTGIKRISRNNNPSQTNSVSGDRVELASSDMRSSSSVASDDQKLMPKRRKDDDQEFISPAASENKDQVVSNPTAEKESSQNGCYDINSRLAHSNSRAPVRKKVGVQKNTIGIKRISRNNHPSKEYCQANSVSGDRIERACSTQNLSAVSMRQKDDNQESISPASEKLSSAEYIGQIQDNSDSKCPAYGKPLSAESIRQIEDNSDSKSPAFGKPLSADYIRQIEDNSDSNTPAFGKPLSAVSTRQIEDNLNSISPASEKGLLAEPERLKGDSGSTSNCSGVPSESTGIKSTTCKHGYEGKVVIVSDEGTSVKDGSSIVGTTLCVAESCDNEIIKSDEDVFDMEIIEDDEFAEPRFENFQREKLDESCVMVEGDELRSLTQGTKKQKSYKKKIREALSSKLRPRKDERHKDLSGKNDDEAVKEGCDALESDWEYI